jgi:hypothetical protein
MQQSTARKRLYVPINSNCDNVKLQNVSVTLTFEVEILKLDTSP